MTLTKTQAEQGLNFIRNGSLKDLEEVMRALVRGDFFYVSDTEVTATAAELNRVADVSSRIVTITGDLTLTEATHSDKVLLLGEVGGDAAVAVTLPAATGSGARFHFKVSVVNTSGYTIKVTGNDTMDGAMILHQDGADTVVSFNTAADSDTITLNGTTTGGVSIGDWLEVVDIATDQWAVTGIVTASGTEATPFSATVT